jgi:hypothetical protein
MAPVDPITFEIIRHRLWAINDDQARMAARLSGSITVFEGYDFNAALTTADGRGLYCGVYILHHGATVDVFVRRVLEDWPIADIAPGDLFFTNDPWWGSLHANDGILAMPVIWQGELVAWSGIVMHDSDVGSPVPGSFVSGAPDRFAEAPLFPALRIGRDFELLADIERAYLRNSRTPTLNALNMRARLAALRSTHQRICELIEQYGLDAFRATQEEIVAYVERVVRGRLRALPDGSWYAEGYHDHDGRENKTYRICCRIDKRGERITFDMTGTVPQVRGSINCARPAMEGAVMGVLLTYLCYDLPWAIGGLRPIAEIVSAEGTLNNALSPAGVSMASTTATLTTQDVVANAGKLDSRHQRRCHRRAGPCRRAPRGTGHGFLQRRRRCPQRSRRDRQRRDLPLDGVPACQRRDGGAADARAPALPPRALRRRRPGPLSRRHPGRIRHGSAQAAAAAGGAQHARLRRQRTRWSRSGRRRARQSGDQRRAARNEHPRAVCSRQAAERTRGFVRHTRGSGGQVRRRLRRGRRGDRVARRRRRLRRPDSA